MEKLLKRVLLALLMLLAVPAMTETNPHDGYVFWLPCGELKIGDQVSEKEFNYTKTETGETFIVHPRATRFEIPRGQIVIVRPGQDRLLDPSPTFRPGLISINGENLYSQITIGNVLFIPRKLTDGKKEVKISISNAQLKTGDRYLVYYTDDSDKLGFEIGLIEPKGHLKTDDYALISRASATTSEQKLLVAYASGISAFWKGNYSEAKVSFLQAAGMAENPEAQRLFRRLIRWCDTEMQFQEIKTGQGYYDLGLYSMVNGYWDLAADCFTKATELMPKNPDAWYMLGDAMSYKISDLDLRMEKCYPYYRKAADLYPRENSNTYRTHFGLYRNLKIKEGDKIEVRHITDEEIAHTKKMWEWDSALMESASRGALRMVNTYTIVDKEVDNTDAWAPKPFEGLFKRGECETFMKMTDWGASDACGHDCGPDRSAIVNMGIRTWDTYLHEWNHTLDWAMITSELGTGVPTTHSSDWCGFEPIPSMGMGHHSCNRYYMTPGMYRYVRGSDPQTTPYIKDWMVTKPSELAPAITDEQIKDEKFINDWMTKVHKQATEVKLPNSASFKVKPKIVNGYIDLKSMYPDTPKNAYTFARTYIFSPKKQKVRMWIGADDNMRMWLNGKLIHKGTTYWACALFTEAKEKDHTAKGVMLEAGENELIVQITNAQHNIDWLGGNPPDARGFSVRICDMYNKKIPGLSYSAVELKGWVNKTNHPELLGIGHTKGTYPTYSWEKVADDYTTLIPELTIDDLRKITGYKTMTATNEIFFDLSKETLDPAIRPYVIDKADPNNVTLNNELNWFFSPKEFAAVVRYKKDGQVRDLLFLKPESYESYLKLIPVTSEAQKLGIKRHADQVIGYFLTERDESPNGRIVLVVDTYLGDKLPVDEEDLLKINGLK